MRRDAAAACRASPRRRARSRVDRDAGELDDRVGSAHVRERVVGHDHDVGEAEQQRRAGDAGADDREHGRHDSRRVREGAGDAAPTVERGDVLAQLRSRRVEHADDGHARLEAHRDRPRDRRRRPPRRCAPWCLPPATRNQATGRPPISRSPAVAAASTCAPIATATVTTPGATIRLALWPPKPNEFDIAGPAGTARGAPATTSSWMSSPSRSRFAVGGTSSVGDREQAGDGLGRAGGADEVAGDALRRGRRRGSVAEHLAMASASAASLSGVDVPCALTCAMSAGTRPASSSASCMHAAAPPPPGDGAVMWYASELRP